MNRDFWPWTFDLSSLLGCRLAGPALPDPVPRSGVDVDQARGPARRIVGPVGEAVPLEVVVLEGARLQARPGRAVPVE